jgi:hypothetical protein
MSTLKVNNITDTSGGTSNLNVPGAAKAWVNFDGIGTVAINDDFNVSTLTDNGVADYTVTFDNAMSNANYAAFCEAKPDGVYAGSYQSIQYVDTRTTSTVRIKAIGDHPSGSIVDKDDVCVVVFN